MKSLQVFTNSFVRVILIINLLLISCSKGEDEDFDEDNTETSSDSGMTDKNDIYVIGYEKDESYNNVYKYWKNGQAVILKTDNRIAELKGIAVRDIDVYVVGNWTNAAGRKQATVWKNGVPSSLSQNPESNNSANGIFVSGNDIYIVGQDVINSKLTAVYWKNGVKNILPNEASVLGSAGSSVIVNGGNIHIAGHQSPVSGIVWMNGNKSFLEAGSATSYLINSIGTTTSGDIYVVGTVFESNFRARLWKNNQITNLTLSGNASNANSLFIDGNDVYVAGNETETNNLVAGKVWKNGVPTKLESVSNAINPMGIHVVEGNVYVAGDKLLTNGGGKKGIVIWKNYKEFSTLTDPKNDSQCYGIYVVKK